MRSVEFDPDAFEDLAWWLGRDRSAVPRIIKLIRDIQRDPLGRIGKPERLKHDLAGCWSRRIDQEHRIVYEVKGGSHPDPLLPLSLPVTFRTRPSL